MLKHSLKQPQTTNDFVVTVSDKDWKHEWMEMMSCQITRTEINLVTRQMVLYVRQLTTGHIQDLIFHLLDKDSASNRTIDEVRVRPAKRQAYEYVFTNGKLIDHGVAFDYYDADVVQHKMVLSFDRVRLHSKEDHAIAPTVDV